eukprot:Seg1546.21 transcript_id=Seg1546.21/GoldUCD/mRNA.D3Y31 product="hypothetical protein" protein_id=Seg1546.21/GoldUCD/D3Y31
MPGGKFIDVSQEVKDCPLECIPNKIILLVDTNDMSSHSVMEPVASTDKRASVDFKELLLSTRSHFPTSKTRSQKKKQSCGTLRPKSRYCPGQMGACYNVQKGMENHRQLRQLR